MFAKEKIRAVLYGAATADALGAPYEFFSPKEIASKKIEMKGGKNPLMTLRPGEWSDDTEMTLLLAETISEGMPLHFENLAKRYIAWADSGPKDIGNTTREALESSNGFSESVRRAAEYYRTTGRSAGNGTIMRASPLAFLPLKGKAWQRGIETEARITHAAPEAWEASYLQALAIRQMLQGGRLDLPKDGWSSKIGEVLENYRDEEYLALQVRAGGTSWSSLGVALHSLRFASYREGVLWAISLGYDTDTNASCAGALLAARDGFSALPKEWLSPLERKERIERAAEGLARI